MSIIQDRVRLGSSNRCNLIVLRIGRGFLFSAPVRFRTNWRQIDFDSVASRLDKIDRVEINFLDSVYDALFVREGLSRTYNRDDFNHRFYHDFNKLPCRPKLS